MLNPSKSPSPSCSKSVDPCSRVVTLQRSLITSSVCRTVRPSRSQSTHRATAPRRTSSSLNRMSCHGDSGAQPIICRLDGVSQRRAGDETHS